MTLRIARLTALLLLSPGVLLVFLPTSGRADDDLAALRLYFDEDTLVETSTRQAKPIARVAENVSIVTAAEIRDMNAHSLAQVLDRVTGAFVSFFGHHFGATALPHLQGSGSSAEERHVLVLLDGIPWSSETAGPFLDMIPVGQIDRIEVIKGPASSTWGSSLGGVVNVITKQPGTTVRPRGELAGSYGERRTWDARAEVAGVAGSVGYYLQGQAQHAEWDDAGASFESRAGVAKAEVPLAAATLRLSGGLAKPSLDAGRLASSYALAQADERAAYGRAGLDLAAGPWVGVHLDAYRFDQRVNQFAQEDGTFAPVRDLLRNETFDEEHTGLQGRATWTRSSHAVVLGADYRHTRFGQTTDSGAFFQSRGAPARFVVDTAIDRWGIYFNDTFTWGSLTLVPGLRYDDSSRTDSFWSPSLGAVWSLGRVALVRASAARGFTDPPLNFLTGGGIDTDPNPDLGLEVISSYQVGVEARVSGFAGFKVTAFRHEVTNAIRLVASTGPGSSTWTNEGWVWRTGFEAEARTDSWMGLTASLGYAHVRVETSGVDRTRDQNEANLGVFFDPSRGFHVELFGHYVWWDRGPGFEEGAHNDLVWDANVRKAFPLGHGAEADLYTTLHNLSNGDQQTDTDRGTEPRWVEAGVRVRF